MEYVLFSGRQTPMIPHGLAMALTGTQIHRDLLYVSCTRLEKVAESARACSSDSVLRSR